MNIEEARRDAAITLRRFRRHCRRRFTAMRLRHCRRCCLMPAAAGVYYAAAAFRAVATRYAILRYLPLPHMPRQLFEYATRCRHDTRYAAHAR